MTDKELLELAAMTQERDENRKKHESCVTINERLLSDNRILKEELAASQAREQQLREALETLKSCTATEGQYGRAIQKTISNALALPQDDSALKAWGAKLLREWAGEGDYVINRKADELEGS